LSAEKRDRMSLQTLVGLGDRSPPPPIFLRWTHHRFAAVCPDWWVPAWKPSPSCSHTLDDSPLNKPLVKVTDCVGAGLLSIWFLPWCSERFTNFMATLG
jgi:hypothetical protein